METESQGIVIDVDKQVELSRCGVAPHRAMTMDLATVLGGISQPALVVLAGLLALLGAVLIHEVRAWGRLAPIPGPWWSGNTFTSTYWLLKKALAGHLHSDFRELTDRYGR